MRNKYRDQMKRETAHLRIRVDELESELQALRQGRKSASSSPKNRVIMNAAWQRLTESQQQLRFAAEAKNWRLKCEVHERPAQTLATRPSGNLQHALVASSRRGQRRSKTENAAFFKDLVNDLDVAFQWLDGLFAATDLDRVDSEMTPTIEMKTAVKNENGDAALLVQICGVQVTPFHNSTTADVSWKSTVEQFFQRKPWCAERVWHNNGNVVASTSRSGWITGVLVSSGGEEVL